MSKSFFKKCIVAVSGRKTSIDAAMYSIMMARTYNMQIKFVYVVDTATLKFLMNNRFLIADEKSDFEEELTADGKRYLAYVQNLAKAKGVHCETELLYGGVFTEIIKAAEKFEADLIIIGGGGKHSNKKTMLSREENEILVSCGCPVMVVQKPDIEKIFKAF